MIGKLIKYLIYLAVLGAIGIAAYAFIFELPAPSHEVVVPVQPASQ